MVTIPTSFISCDWGTSNFRLSHVRTESLEILEERCTSKGIGKLYHRYTRDRNVGEQYEFFSAYLLRQLHKLRTFSSGKQVPVIISGMASSNIGLMELKYAKMPIDAGGTKLFSHSFDLDDSVSVVLISGARTDTDIMRGEETQAVGLSNFIDMNRAGTLILPGTHSKHISFQDGMYTDFKTFLSGELFQMLSSRSILRKSVKEVSWNESFREVFLRGARQAKKAQLPEVLFSIRAEHVLGKQNREQGFYRLCGLVLGSELAYLGELDTPIYVAASEGLDILYKTALEELTGPEQTTCLDQATLNQALHLAHRNVLLHSLSKP